MHPLSTFKVGEWFVLDGTIYKIKSQRNGFTEGVNSRGNVVLMPDYLKMIKVGSLK